MSLQSHQIEEIVQLLHQNKLLSKGSIDKSIALIEKATEDRMYIIWSIEDLDNVTKEGIELSRSDKIKILENVRRHADCEYGVSWENLRQEVENYLERRK